uniref:calcium/calmodulin-dependent protein kinase kinase 2-like n=2 Tax=Podarcis TaxID=42163 RepID=UPI0010A016D9|nr:calcium/calmodulin-dependent protein kinase kinase 2-like [Podarcis muralis]
MVHPWVTKNGVEPLPTEDENCTLIEVTEEEVENSVKHIPSLATVILVKSMIRKRSFGNPFEGSRREERSLSAPGNLLTKNKSGTVKYFISQRKQNSEDNLKSISDLPNVGENELLS